MEHPINHSPYSGFLELSWPGKNNSIVFKDGKWIMLPNDCQLSYRALLYEKELGSGENIIGYAVDADQLTGLASLKSYMLSKIQLIYFDAPRLKVFQSASISGYTTSTWLSLLRQTAVNAIPLLTKNGFFVLHTDEEMSHYARMVLEEIFGKNHYVGTLAWQKQYAPQNDLNIPTDVLDYIIVLAKILLITFPK
ncbi:MAG: hypothetical protein K2H76_01860 [Muribaculaceae bacterium]|nr:hypothetical protein [Muribaculaceae bacterium]